MPAHLSLSAPERGPSTRESPSRTTDLRAIERDMIARALGDVAGNKSRAARRLGLSRTQLYGRLRKYQIDR